MDELTPVGAVIVVSIAVVLSILGAQDFESQSSLGKVQVRVRVFREVVLLLELAVVGELLSLGVQMRPDEPSNI